MLAFSLILSCQKKDKDTFIQIIRADNQKGSDYDSVKLFFTPIMDYEYIIKDRMDSSGRVTARPNLKKSFMGTVQVGNKYSSVLLRSGDELTIEFSLNEGAAKFIFKSDDPDNNIGHLNNYLSQTANVIGDAQNEFIGKEVDQFLMAFDSLSSEIDQYHQHFLDSIPLKSDEVDMIIKINKLKLLDSKLWYTFRRHNDFLVDQIYAFREGREIEKYVMSEQLNKIMNEVPIDSILLKSEIYGNIYKSILFAYSAEAFSLQFVNPKLWDRPDPNNPMLISNAIKLKNHTAALSEYFQASNIRYYMQESGVTEVIDSLYTSFSNEFPNSKFIPALQMTYDQQVAIVPGTIAPDFRGTKVDGTIINLSDFKGRVVYVDVWATWCAPCVEEIPYAKELHETFENSDQVIFLNVSVDKDIDAWKRKVAKEKDWKGVHINLSKSQTDSLAVKYRVVGYPKYFLIDKDGRIVTSRAPRPSSKDVIKKKIQQLIQNKVLL